MLSCLSTDFAIKDLGPLHYFLGVEVLHTPDGLFLTQQRYILDLLQRTNMMHAKPMSSPMSAAHTLSLFAGDPLPDATEYRSTVGALQYLSLTRPDISFAVNKVCQFMHRPTIPHWQAVKRILRYLKATLTHGLTLRRTHTTNLEAYSDADWAGCPDDRKSTSGYCVFLGPNLISWSSRKQPTVSRSSTESEYRALATTAAELLWLQSLLRELGLYLRHPPTIWCDNIGATYLSSNPVFHARTKHIEIDYHFVRDRVANGCLDVRYRCTQDQVADILTKPIVSRRYHVLRDKLNIRDTPLTLRGPF